MNILIPNSWLSEYLTTDADHLTIQKLLSLSGPSVERIYDIENEPVFDIEVTTNRVDSMSVRGIAREAAVILSQAGLQSSLVASKIPNIATFSTNNSLPLPKIIDENSICNRITCVVLDSVNHSESPEWMKKRFSQISIGTHHAAIDITNYITHALGHPCHAFDYDKIMNLGGEISVVEASKGMPFTTLDGEEYTTVGGEIVFVNQDNVIIDLPAIKGTLNTAVDDNTSRIILWIESIPAKKVRFASMTHAIRTTAAQLNEKNVDPNLAEDTLAYGISLYQELCGATVASAIFDSFPGKKETQVVVTPLSIFKRYLGVELQSSQIVAILEQLGCTVTKTAENLEVTPPTFRPDLEIPADIVEEVARIYGYHNLPSKLMDTAIPVIKPENLNYSLEHRLKEFLADSGWQELYTYSMVSEQVALESGYKLEEHLKLQNPLTDDRVFLRRSLIPSLTEVKNQNQHWENFSAFEIAAVYEPKINDIPDQKITLGLVSTQNYRQLRATIECVAAQFYLKITISPDTEPAIGFYQSASIFIQTQKTNETDLVKLGTVGQTHSGLLAALLDIQTLTMYAKSNPEYQPLPTTAPIIEDLTFTLPENTLVGEVLESIASTNNLIESVTLISMFRQNITVRIIFRSQESNLSVADIEPIRKHIVATTTETFNATLVGSV